MNTAEITECRRAFIAHDGDGMMKIVVGYDMTEPAEKAFAGALEYAGNLKAQLILIASLVGGTKEDVEEINAFEKGLRVAHQKALASGVACEKHLLMRGRQPGEDIVAFARETSADLVVIGIKKRSKVGKLMFGSTAQYVILACDCPVLAVK
jgi:nucleotide-binding universal stress UspA family protein